MENTVVINNLSKTIKNNILFSNVNIKLEKGKIYGLIGANGSGKSTLLRILLGLSKYKGDCFIEGYNIRKNYKEALSYIGGIVDYVSFYDFLTAEENLRYFALLYEVNTNKINELLNIVKLPKDKKLVKYYSLGMKQRLGIAISLLKDPSILVLDEPTNGLDPKGIRDLRELITSMKDKTIIVSSHLISEVEKITKNIIFINNNTIVQKDLSKNTSSLEDTLIKMMEGYND